MFNYAQLDNDYCMAVSMLSGEIIQENLIRIEEYDTKYIGKLYRNDVFYGLSVESINAVVVVKWLDLDGNIVNETEEVKASCQDVEEIVEMTNGIGSLKIEAEESGTYIIEIISASGCRVQVEVAL